MVNMFLSNYVEGLLLFLIISVNIHRDYSFELLYQTNRLVIDSNATNLANENPIATSPALPTEEFFNFGLKKKQFQQQSLIVNIPKIKVEVLSKLLKIHVDRLRDKTDQVELVFLVDASASVGLENFRSELNFVRKLLSDFTVAPAAARVAVVTFAGKTSITRHVDQISTGEENNHKCRLLNQQLVNVSYSGGGTYTRGALLEALDILERSRSGASKAVFLITDGFSNGGDPRSAATLLKQSGAVVFTFGIRTGNIEELHDIASEPGYTHSYLLDSFPEFEALARRALHHDLQAGDYIAVNSREDCNLLCFRNTTTHDNATQCCDDNASCTCGVATGHYACLCHPGYFGSGFYGFCKPCQNGTFGIGKIPGDSNAACIPCPDPNHITVKTPAIGPADCVCAEGFTTNGNKCEAITCPKLKVPENGYLVKASACNNVVNAACGIRCKIGFHLTGDSIRLCLNSGTWSGTEPQCLLKTCPALRAPAHGKIRCEHEDDRQVISAGLSAFPIDTHCEYKCDIGYQLRGSQARNCLPLSRWDGLKVSCRTIKCQPLSSIPNGEITPEFCVGFDKVLFGTICTIRCKSGFIVKGPANKVCGGRTGSWSHRHNITQCVDSTPPTITCPSNITTETLPGKNYSIVNWTKVMATDNSEIIPTVWSEPSVTAPWEIGIGTHIITYIAQDASKNKAECKFSIAVVDKELPIVENCINPPVYLLENDTGGGANITWEEPVFYDNSGYPVEINRSHVPGRNIFNLGTTEIIYNATDNSMNTRTCVMNITVEDACANFPYLLNGHSSCATLKEGVQCVVTCDEGYTFVVPQPVSYLDDENVTLTCNRKDHSWNNDNFPDCSVTQVPYAVTQDLTVVVDVNSTECQDPITLNILGDKIKVSLESQLTGLCNDEIECNVSQFNPICKGEIDDEISLESNAAEATNSKSKRSIAMYLHRARYEKAMMIDNGEFHIRERRASPKKNKGEKKRDKIEWKFKIIGKIIDNNKNNPKQGMVKLREKLDIMINNGQLNLLDSKTNQEVAKLVLNLYVIFEKPQELCSVGSILKKHSCVKCPLGTFHNTTKNQCQSCMFGEYQDEFGSEGCKKCPEHTSTRKKHTESLAGCIPVCHPGYYSRRKRHLKSTLALEPCITCEIGFYQSKYAQTKCIPCPENTTTIRRGVSDVDQCFVLNNTDKNPCYKNPCHNEGSCTRVDNDFSCKCKGEFIGSTCEILPNPCNSSPCLNEGHCIFSNDSNNSLGQTTCLCKSGYTGVNCEIYIDECVTNPCQNNGTCVSTDEDFTCVCQDGFEGEVCEIAIDHCEVSPCEEGSLCRSVDATWQCTCKPGFLGRRCNRLPCDWFPCPEKSICVNVEVMNATKKSYKCKCPDGYTGKICNERIDHCVDLPCVNNGTCINNLLNYSCECPKEFRGLNCEIELSSLYAINFPKSGTTDYVMINGPNKNLNQFTLCLWLQSFDTFNYGTVLSYATPRHDNALTLTDYNGFVIYINGNRVVTDITANDGYWHFICITWENIFGFWQVFMDGDIKDNGTLLANGMEIEGNGTLVIGQEQDHVGGGFSESESLLGKLSLLDMWDKVLDDEVIQHLSTQCEPYHGSLYSWAQLQGYLHGNIEIQNSTFCHPCPLPVAPFKGKIQATNNTSEIVYSCETGYLIKYGQKTSTALRRRCLKQGQWEGYYTPTCTRIKCGFPGYFPRGQLHGRSYSYGDEIHYSCSKGTELRGNPHRICTADGTWSGVQPMCVGTTCKNLLAPDNGDIEYIIEEYERDDVSILQVGQQLEFKCNPGFRPLGAAILTCMENGKWDYPAPKCVMFGCPPPESIENGYIASNVSIGVEMLSPKFSSFQSDNSVADGASLESGYLYGDVVSFSCHKGYKFFGNNNKIAEFRIQCANNGSWNGIVPNCVPLHCRKPEVIENGKFYLLSKNDTTTEILKSEKFSNLTFIKKLVPISTQPSPNFQGPFDIPISTDELHFSNFTNSLTKRNTLPEDFQTEFNTSFILESQILIICNKGYKIIGPSVRTCTENETWSLTSPSCEPLECSIKQHPLINILKENKDKVSYDNKKFQADEESQEVINIFKENSYLRGTLEYFTFVYNGNVFGDTISLTCLNGTTIDFDIGINRVLKSINWMCNDNGIWELLITEANGEKLEQLLNEKKEAFCQKTVCSLPNVPTNGYLVNVANDSISKKAGDIVKFKCRHGYNLVGNESAECLPYSTWSAIPNCEPVNCGKPPVPLSMVLDDTSAEASDYIFGNMISYTCIPGYKLYGRGSLRCLANGKWSKLNGKCFRISCGKPKPPQGVKISGPSYLFRDQLTYICPNKIPQGTITCKSDGKWSEFPDCTIKKVNNRSR